MQPLIMDTLRVSILWRVLIDSRFLIDSELQTDHATVRIRGIKYLVHRLVYQAYHGDLQASLDVSHTVYIGGLTTK